jgi:hypothetical protein
MSGQLSLFDDVPVRPKAETPPLPGFTDLAPSLTDELAQVWGLPLGRKVRVELRHHQVNGLTGMLQAAGLPDLPFNARAPLRLRIGHMDFNSRQIVTWSVLE